MKKYLATVTVAAAVFASTTLSAAGYWETIWEYLPDWRDFVPGMAKPQIEETQPTLPTSKINPRPVPKNAPKPKSKPFQSKVVAKPAGPGVAAQPVEKPAQSKVVVKPESTIAAAESEDVKKPAPKRKRVSPRRVKRSKLAQRKLQITKPASEPIEHPSKVSPPEMALSCDLEKGMSGLAAAIATAPYVEKTGYNRNMLAGVVNCVNTLASQASSKPFTKMSGQLNQAYSQLFPSKKALLFRPRTTKPADAFNRFQNCIVALGQTATEINTATATAAFKTMLTKAQKALSGRKICVDTIYGQLATMEILAHCSGHPSALQFKKLMIAAQRFKANPKDRTPLVNNIDAVLKSL